MAARRSIDAGGIIVNETVLIPAILLSHGLDSYDAATVRHHQAPGPLNPLPLLAMGDVIVAADGGREHDQQPDRTQIAFVGMRHGSPYREALLDLGPGILLDGVAGHAGTMVLRTEYAILPGRRQQ